MEEETFRLAITSAEGNLASKTQCVPGGSLPGECDQHSTITENFHKVHEQRAAQASAVWLAPTSLMGALFSSSSLLLLL